MKRTARTSQLQIRVSPAQKAALKRRARRAGMSVSAWVLEQALPPAQQRFQATLEDLGSAEMPGFVFAEINELLAGLTRSEFELAVSEAPRARLDPYLSNYVAAMVEHAAMQKKAKPPAWTAQVPPLRRPVFGTGLRGLRLHLLTRSPIAFRRRNIFIDSSVGDRV